MSLFDTIQGSHWLAAARRGKNEPNVAWQQIQRELSMNATKLLVAAVETALYDLEQAKEEIEESQLRVPSEYINGRIAMYTKALAVYRASLSRGDEPVASDGHRATSVNSAAGILSS